MTGYRMIPCRPGSDDAGKLALAADRICLCVRHVGCDDDRHDDALSGADHPRLRTCWTPRSRKPAVRLSCMVCGRLFAGVDRLFTRCDLGAMGPRTCSFAHADDGQCEQNFRRYLVDRCRALPMDTAEGRLLIAVPGAAWVHPESRRLPGSCNRFIDAGLSPRGLLSRMLLGADGSPLCSRCDEFFWIAALAILVLLEKVIPSGRVIARIAGIVSFAGGLWMLFQPS